MRPLNEIYSEIRPSFKKQSNLFFILNDFFRLCIVLQIKEPSYTEDDHMSAFVNLSVLLVLYWFFQWPGGNTLSKLHPAITPVFVVTWLVSISVALFHLYDCLSCTAHADTVMGSSDQYTLCKCTELEANWFLLGLTCGAIEIYAWKPWRRIELWTTLTSWKLGLVMFPLFLLTVLSQVITSLLLSGVAMIPVYRSLGYVEAGIVEDVVQRAGIGMAVFSCYMIHRWHKDLNVASTSETNPEDEAPATGKIARCLLSLRHKSAACKEFAAARLGNLVFHVQLLVFEAVEIGLQLQFMFSILPLVPYNEWLMVMTWLVFATLATMLCFASKRIRDKSWSLKLMVFIEVLSDLVFLWYSLYSLQFLTLRSIMANLPTLGAVTQFLMKLQLGVLHVCPQSW